MYKLICLLVLALFLLEELFHRHLGKSGRLHSKPSKNDFIQSNFDRFDLVRLFELLLFGILLSTPAGNVKIGHGQLASILVGLQIARLFGRRILRRWSVLGVLQLVEIFFILSILLIPLKENLHIFQLNPLTVTTLASGILFGILTAMSTTFSISYAVRLFSKESSKLYNKFPPLVNSEEWAYKFSRFSLFTGTVCTITLFLLLGVSTLPLFFLISIILQYSGFFLCRIPNYRGHHTRAHLLWSLSFLILYFLIVFGFTSTTL